MKLRNPVIVLPVVGAVAIGAALWWHHQSPHTPPPGTNNIPETAATESASPPIPGSTTDFAAASAQSQRQLAQMGITPGMTKEQIQQKTAEWYRSQRELLADKWKNPISFYGKVVTFIWNDTSESGSSKSSATSDRNGFFSLTGVTGFAYEAPESGYQPVVEFRFQKGDTNWTERIDKTFYVAFGTPRKYGRLHVETTMTSGTILDYAINPVGSRNLEPK
jgi:hypothetical protein